MCREGGVWAEGRPRWRVGMMAAGPTFIPNVLVFLLWVLEGSPVWEQEGGDVSEAGQKRVTTCIGLVLLVGAL